MAKRSSSAAALNAILSDENDDNVGSELVVGSDEDDESDSESESEGLQDCEIVESPQSYNETDARTAARNDKGRLHNTPSTSAVSLLSVLKAPRRSELSRKRKVTVNVPPKGKRSTSGKNS